MENGRPKGSPSPPPKEQTSYWALPTPGGRWRTAGFNRLEDEDPSSGSHTGAPEVGGGAEPALEQSARAPGGFAQPGSTPSTPGSMKKQRSLKTAKPERPAARGNSLRMMPNFQLPNFSTYSRIESVDNAMDMAASPPREHSFPEQSSGGNPYAIPQARYQQHDKLTTGEAPSLIAFSPRDASPMQTAPDGESDTDTASSCTLDRADGRSQAALSSRSLVMPDAVGHDAYNRTSVCSNSSSPDVVAIADNPATSAPVSLLDAAAANAHLHAQPQTDAAAGWQPRAQSPANPPAGSLQGPGVPIPVPRVGQAYRAGHLATRSQPAMGTQHARSQNGHAANGHSNGYNEGGGAHSAGSTDSWNIFEPQAAPVPKMTSASNLRTGRHTRDFVVLKCMRGKDLLQVMAQGMPMRKKWVTTLSTPAGGPPTAGKVKPTRHLRLTLDDGIVCVRYYHQGTRGLMNKGEVSAVVEHAEVTDGPWRRGQEIWMFTDKGTLALEAPDASSHATWTFGLNTAFAASQTRRRDYIENCIVKTIPRSDSMIFKQSSTPAGHGM